MLGHIKRYAESNPEKIILGTGDKDQLEPMGDMTNNKDLVSYMEHCIWTIFPNYIVLKEIKRLKKEEQKQQLMRLKQDLQHLNEQLDKLEQSNTWFTKEFKKLGKMAKMAWGFVRSFINLQ